MNQPTNAIIERLREIEWANEVEILYAVESGSRLWNFASPNSDYDIRFIYAHQVTERYLSPWIQEQRDVIDNIPLIPAGPFNNALDFSGWDIRKALRLYLKGNPPLGEWLRATVPEHIYVKPEPIILELKDLATRSWNPEATVYHYLNMAKSNYREYLQGDTVRTKKYFYVIRPVLAVMWIKYRHTFPPPSFPTLVEDLFGYDPRTRQLKETIQHLRNRKMTGEELAEGPRIDLINEFLDHQIQLCGQQLKDKTFFTKLDHDKQKVQRQLEIYWRRFLGA